MPRATLSVADPTRLKVEAMLAPAAEALKVIVPPQVRNSPPVTVPPVICKPEI